MKSKLVIPNRLVMVVGLLLSASGLASVVELPAEYALLEWIRSNGTQYIDTGVILPEAAVIEAEMVVQKEQPQKWATAFGSRALGAADSTFELDVYAGTFGWYRWCRGAVSSGASSSMAFGTTTAFYGQRNTVRCSLKDMAWQAADGSGSPETVTVNTMTGDCRWPLYIFALNEAGGVQASSWSAVQLYSFRVFIGSDCVRDFVPCRRRADGEAGLYDCANGVFYANQGTGSFMGSDMPLSLISWLHSSGEQYIDTAYAPRETDSVRAVFEVKTGGKTWATAFGARENGSGGWKHAVELDVYAGDVNQYRYWCGNGAYGRNANFFNQPIEAVCSGGAMSWRPIGAAAYAETLTATSTGDCLRPLYVFAQNDGGSATQYSTLKFHSLDVIAADSTPRRQLRPARDASGNLGLLDLVEGHFYPNLGVTTLAWSGIAYMTKGTTLVAYEGVLDNTDITGFTTLEKATSASLTASAVTNFPALTLGAGVFVLADGEQQTHHVAGTLTLKGGTRLKLDLSRTGCDILVAQNLSIEEADAENPVIIELASVGGAGIDGAYPIIQAAGITADMTDKLKVVGMPGAGVRVENGEIVVFYANPAIPVVAVWTGAGADPGNVTDPANWACTNGLGASISAVPMAETSVRLPEGCTFVCTNGAPFNCRELVMPSTLGGDSDWRGVAAPFLGTMRLNGHKLHLSGLQGWATFTDGDYQRLDFIESTGTQWIRTGVVPTVTTRVECEIAANATQPVSWPAVFGSRNRTNGLQGNEFLFMTHSGSNTARYPQYCQCGSQATATAGSFPYGVKVALVCCGNRAEWSWSDGATVTTNAIEIAGTPNPGLSPMDIFNAVDDYADGPDSILEPYPCAMKLFRFRIYDGTTLVRDFVPVRQIATGKLGLLDLAAPSADQPAFYANAGMGEFKAGCAFEDPAGGELHVDVPEGTTNENLMVSIMGNIRLFKEGEGVYVATCTGQTYGVTHVMEGTLVCGHAPSGLGAELGAGDVKVVDGARLDINVDHGNMVSYSQSEVTHGRTLYLAGDGPDGAGALYNSNLADCWGATIGRLVLTGDASAGGGYFGLRPVAESAMGYSRTTVEGEYVLTVKTTVDHEQTSIFRDCDFDLKRLVVLGGTQLQGFIRGTIAEGCHLKDGSSLLIGSTCTLSEGIRVFVDDGTTTLTTWDRTVTTYQGGLTVLPDATYDFANGSGSTVNLGGTITNAGTIVRSGAGAVNITGTLTGQGALSGGICFAGTESCWQIALDAEGMLHKVDVSGIADANFLANLGRLEVVCEAEPLAQTQIVCAAGDLTQAQLNAIELDVHTAAGASVAGCWLGIESGNLVLHVADAGVVRTAVWCGGVTAAVDDPENWICSNEVAVVAGALPMAATRVILPDHVAFTCTNGAPLTCAELVLPATLGGESDFRGVRSPISGKVRLNGNTLRVSQFAGNWEVEDGQYQLLDYLESSGTQYIDTQMVVTENAKIETEMTVSRSQPNNWASAFGARSHEGNSWDQAFCLDVCCGNVKNCQYRFWRGVGVMGNQSAFYEQRIFISAQLCEFSWKPVGADIFTETLRCARTTGDCIYPMYIFALDENGGAGYFASVRIHSFKIITDGVVTCDLVPARRLSDGALGMLDRANGNAFRENAGSGTFIAGDALPGQGMGELWIDVPVGATVQNDSVAISGAVRLVKEGSGTFVASKPNQRYFGGTEIVAGKFTLGNNTCIGDVASEVQVDSEATLEVNGVYEVDKYKFVLAGGTLQNTGADAPNTKAQIGSLRLTADSTFKPSSNYGLIGWGFAPVPLDLAGHTLTVPIGVGKNFWFYNVVATGGTINVTQGGVMAVAHSSDVSAVTFRINCALDISDSFTVKDYEACYQADYNSGNGIIKILGSFTPAAGARFHGCELVSGATLDLSEQESTFSMIGAFTNGAKEMTFAADATSIKVKLGAGMLPTNGKIVDWTGRASENLEQMKFSLDDSSRRRGRRLVVKEDGLYIKSGLVIILW